MFPLTQVHCFNFLGIKFKSARSWALRKGEKLNRIYGDEHYQQWFRSRFFLVSLALPFSISFSFTHPEIHERHQAFCVSQLFLYAPLNLIQMQPCQSDSLKWEIASANNLWFAHTVWRSKWIWHNISPAQRHRNARRWKINRSIKKANPSPSSWFYYYYLNENVFWLRWFDFSHFDDLPDSMVAQQTHKPREREREREPRHSMYLYANRLSAWQEFTVLFAWKTPLCYWCLWCSCCYCC